MGMESVNYLYKLAQGSTGQAMDLLAELGATRRDLTDDSYWQVTGQDYWVDIEFNLLPNHISFRIALCNPPAAMDVLHRILKSLMNTFGGKVFDLYAEKRYGKITPKTWGALLSDYEKRKTDFKNLFGDFTAAISADEVFDVARQRGLL